MDNYKIVVEHGIPLPPRATNNNMFPYRDMQVGDSFFVPTGAVKGALNTSYWSKVSGFKFAVRKGEGGTRVWRVR